ncbi:hypothetical protein [Escherichia marmotae]|nr:hypothetical protein [Escherichia marmotae]
MTFIDEAVWGRYRKSVSALSKEPEWESIRVEQELCGKFSNQGF